MNTCPVGVATQDPFLRKKFTGAEPRARRQLHALRRPGGPGADGAPRYRSFDKMVGRSERLEMRRAVDHWKARKLEFSRILFKPTVPKDVKRTFHVPQEHGLEEPSTPRR